MFQFCTTKTFKFYKLTLNPFPIRLFQFFSTITLKITLELHAEGANQKSDISEFITIKQNIPEKAAIFEFSSGVSRRLFSSVKTE